MKVTVIASGSGGNATLFATATTRVLVDAGVGPRALAQALRRAERGAMGPDAIVITHAHSDHVGQSDQLARRFHAPVYVSEATARAARFGHDVDLRRYSPREPFAIGDILVEPLPLPHDAAQVALVLGDGTYRAAIVTDLGEVPPALPAHLASCDVLLVEANHDLEMLQSGPYSSSLKQRISSARGHLSNAQAHALLRALPPRAHTVVLMHLSRTNNTPALALEAGRDALAGQNVRLYAAAPSGVLAINAAPQAMLEPLAGVRREPRGQLALPLL